MNNLPSLPSQDIISAFLRALTLVVSVCITGSLLAIAFVVAQRGRGRIPKASPTPPAPTPAPTPPATPAPRRMISDPSGQPGAAAIRPEIFLHCSRDEIERFADLALRYERASTGLAGFPTANQVDGVHEYGLVDLDSALAEFNDDCATYPDDYPLLPSVPAWLREHRRANGVWWPRRWRDSDLDDIWFNPGEFGELNNNDTHTNDHTNDDDDEDQDQEAPPWGAQEGDWYP